jgi:hypothetical protein
MFKARVKLELDSQTYNVRYLFKRNNLVSCSKLNKNYLLLIALLNINVRNNNLNF